MSNWLRTCDLRNITDDISGHHSPATQHRGTYPIDGIFISNTIQPQRRGFLPFGEFPSDHRAIWVDISFDNVFGHKIPKLIIPQARKLKSDDPRVRDRWIELYKNFITRYNLHKKISTWNRMCLYLYRYNTYMNMRR